MHDDALTPILNPDDHRLCYKPKLVKDEPKHVKVEGIFLNHQFGDEQIDTVKEEEFCIPSTKMDLGLVNPPVR